MKTRLSICIVLLALANCQAQVETASWYFGSNAGLTFTTNPPTQLAGSVMHTYEGCSVMSDLAGNMLFYTDGVTVWNKLHQVMPNGTGLYGHSSSSQSATIVPVPGILSLYFIFTAPEINSNDPLAYSIVDLGLSGGLGSVVLKNAPIINSSTEKLAAVRHANGTDVWIIAHPFGNGEFHSYLLSTFGLSSTPVISTVGNPLTTTEHKIGTIKVSPCGTQVAMTNHGLTGFVPSTLELFDFDDSTGQLSNAMQLGSWMSGIFGVEFSPDNSRLYMAFNNPGVLVQFDLTSGVPSTIIASADTIGTSSSILGALQMGLDGRIYVAKYISQSLGCITDPNLLGTACGYNNSFVTLSDSCFMGLPCFMSSYFCDLQTSVSEPVSEEITVFPNPFVDEIHIRLPDAIENNMTVELFDVTGRIVLKKSGEFESLQTINTSFFRAGVYFVVINIENGKSFRQMMIRK